MIQKILSIYSASTIVELQQRSIEYKSLFKSQDSMRKGLLERMPAMERANCTTPISNGTMNGENGDVNMPLSNPAPSPPTKVRLLVCVHIVATTIGKMFLV